ncbi:hypothetical protein FRB99_004744 [Tulasnella sp. 403]|nr:hypothetical protein FRB99_004744 [Tulasnella sp. 403]
MEDLDAHQKAEASLKAVLDKKAAEHISQVAQGATEARQSLQEAEAEIRSLKSQLTQIETLEKMVSQLRHAKESDKSTIDELRALQKSEVLAYEKNFENLKAELRNARDMQEKANAEASNMELKLQDAVSKISDIQAKFDSSVQHVKEMEVEVSHWQRAAEDGQALEKETQAMLQESRQTLQREQEVFQNDRKRFKSRISELTQQVADLDAHQHLKQCLDESNVSVAKLRQEVQALSDTNKTLETTVTEYRTTYEESVQADKRLKEEVESMSQAFHHLEKETSKKIEMLEADVKARAEQEEEHERTIEDLNRQIASNATAPNLGGTPTDLSEAEGEHMSGEGSTATPDEIRPLVILQYPGRQKSKEKSISGSVGTIDGQLTEGENTEILSIRNELFRLYGNFKGLTSATQELSRSIR